MATITWNNTNNGFWDTISNWTGGLPSSTTVNDDVVINIASKRITATLRTGTINVKSLSTKETFIYSGGQLTANTINIDGDLVTGGNGTDTNSDGINDDTSLLVPQVAFTNSGNINIINGGDLVIGELDGSDFTNNAAGIINVTNSRLSFGGYWDNNGTINLNNNGQLQLIGYYNNDSFGTINRLGSNTKVFLQGIFNNSLLTLNSTTGSYILKEGGEIIGGTIDQQGVNLAFNPFLVEGGVITHNLNGVTVEGDINLNNVSGSSVLLKNSTTFTGVANLGDYAILAFEDLINGQYVIGNTINLNGLYGDLTVQGGTVLVLVGQVNLNNSYTEIRSDIQTQGGSLDTGKGIVLNLGTITANKVSGNEFREIDPDQFINRGTINAINGVNLLLGNTNKTWSNDPEGIISANNSLLRFAGNFQNQGTLSLAGTSELQFIDKFNPLDIGTLSRSGSSTKVKILGTLEQDGADTTLNLNSNTGNFILDGGMIKDIQINQAGGNLEFTNNINNVLFGTTVLNNGLNLNTSGGLVTLRNGAKFTGTANNISGSSAKLIVDDNDPLNDNQQINFDNFTLNLSGGNSILGIAGTDTIILGPNSQINLSGNGANLTSDLGAEIGLATGNGTILNQGQIIANSNTGNVTPDVFSNEGTVTAQNGATLVVGGSTFTGNTVTINNYSSGNQTLTGGTWQVLQNSTMRLNGANIVNNAATIVLDGVNSNLLNVGSSALSDFANNTNTGNFTIRNGRNLSVSNNFTNAGNLNVGNSSTFTIAGGNYSQTAGILSGNGTIAATNFNFNGGTFNLGSNLTLGTFNINGNYIQGSTGVVNIEIGGKNSGQFDVLNISNAASFNNSTINVSFLNGFTAQSGDSFRIINYASRTGNINFNLPSLASGLSWTTQYNGDNITLLASGVSSNISINNVNLIEGNTGSNNATFNVSLSTPSAQTVTLQYATADVTAIAGSDYTTTSGTLVFNPGETSKTIDVPILNDNINEADKTFSVMLSNAQNGVITQGTGTATISDTLFSSVTTTLSTNVENLTLTGINNINGTGNAVNNILTGNNGNNILQGGYGQDIIIGNNGNDYLAGNNQDDSLMGGLGNDTLYGGYDNDTVDGEAGNDTVYGNDGRDSLMGGTGNDVLDGGIWKDTMVGGEGNDVYWVDDTADVIIETSTTTTEIDGVRSTASYSLSGNLEYLILEGTTDLFGQGDGQKNTINGNIGNNFITGGDSRDILTGFDGNDRLRGDAGSDSLDGGNGNDTLIGYAGASEKDTFTGGANNDVFFLGNSTTVFYNGDGNNGYGTITDLATGDKIQLKALSSNYNLITNQNFVGTTALDTAIKTTSGDIIGVVQDNTSLITSMTSSFFTYV